MITPPINIKVMMPFVGDAQDITWEPPINTTGECGWQVLGYNIYKSIDGGIFIKLNDTPITDLFYRDPEAPYSNFAKTYYELTSVIPTGESVPSEPVSLENTDYGELQYYIPEFIRRSQLILNFDGEDGFIYTRKRAGKRCYCFDENSGSGNNRCPNCFGTFRDGGYNKYPTKIRYIPANAQKILLTDGGLAIDNRARMWMMTYPIIHSDDLLVRKTGERYWFADTREISTRGITTRQESSLVQINSQEIEFDLR